MADNKKKEGQDRVSKDAEGDVNERPLTPKDEEAPHATNPKEQEAANQFAEQTRGTVWGDNTGSGEKNNNIPGMHGRDGGFSEGSPNNPAPEMEQVDPDASKDGDAKGEVERGIKTL